MLDEEFLTSQKQALRNESHKINIHSNISPTSTPASLVCFKVFDQKITQIILQSLADYLKFIISHAIIVLIDNELKMHVLRRHRIS